MAERDGGGEERRGHDRRPNSLWYEDVEVEGFTSSDKRGFILAGMVAGILSLAVALAVVLVVRDEQLKIIRGSADRARVEAQRTSVLADRTACNRIMVRNALIRLTINGFVPPKRERTFGVYFSILDCEKTYAPDSLGTAVRLPAVLDACFLRLVEKGYFDEHEIVTEPDKLRTICRAQGEA